MVVLDNLVVSTAIPVLRVDLGGTIEQLESTHRDQGHNAEGNRA